MSRVIAQVTSAVAHEYALSAIVDAVIDQTVETLGARIAYVLLADEDRRELKLVGQRNLPDDFRERLSVASFDAPLLTTRAASTRQIQIESAGDAIKHDIALTQKMSSRTGCRTLVAIPLIAHHRLVGVQAFGLAERHEFGPEEQAALRTCAEIFAFGIWKAGIYEEERKLRSIFEAVGNAALAIVEEIELKPVLQSIVDEARRVTGAEYAGLGIAVSPERPFQPWVFSGLTEEVEKSIGRHPRPVGTLGVVAWEGRTLRASDLQRLPGFRGFPPHHPLMSSLLGVPIRYKHQSVGNLYLANKRGAAEFSREDERAVELLAAHAGAAVYQASLRQELATEKARFTSIVENAPYGLVFVEAGTDKVIANRRALDLAGLESTPTIAAFHGRIRTPEGNAVSPDQWPDRRVQRGEPFETQEMLVRGQDGREVAVLISASPVFRPDGVCDGAIIVYEDISKLKEQQHLREEWTSIITHDLRQPLNVIMLNVGLLRELAENHDSQALFPRLEQTEDAVDALNRMINDLADVSRIESNQLEVRGQPVQLDKLVRDAIERQRAASGDRMITLRTTGAIPQLNADPVRIEQALGNLLSNALKYSDPGTPVEVELRSVNDEVRVEVTNRGPGIPAAELPKLFQRYFRGSRARTGAQAGLGLGLYITKGLIEAHGGRIWAESHPGETTTFQFALPATRGASHH